MSVSCGYEPASIEESQAIPDYVDFGPSVRSDDDVETDDDQADDDGQEDNDNADDDVDDDDLDDHDDPDRDGVVTAEEIEAGTDPMDPSDAPAWHPEWSDFPRLVTDLAGWEEVRARIESGDARSVAIYQSVKNQAARAVPVQPADHFEPSYLEYRGQIARAKAFQGWMEDDAALAVEAAQVCADTRSEMRRIHPADYDQGTIHGGQGMITLSQTYDLLMGLDLATPALRDACAQSIAQVAANLWEFYGERWPIVTRLTQNNHNIKYAAGFLAVGMTLNRRPEAARYVNFGLTDMNYFLLERQNCAGGCQAEGPNYFDYSALSFWPAMIAYHRFALGEAYPYKTDCRFRLRPGCREDVAEVADPLLDARLAEILHWRLMVAMPRGSAANFDDSNMSCGFPGLAAALLDSPEWAYWDDNGGTCRHSVGALDLELLATLPDLPEAAPPQTSSWFAPEAGQAVLRTGWDADDAFALLMGEHGKARVQGVGHEHPDSGSFIWHARGELLAIDSGYIEFSQRRRVANAWNHNLILVDGQGPPSGLLGLGVDVDARLDNFVDTADWKSVKVRNAYRGAFFERMMGLAPGAFFLVADRVASGDPHRYDWLFHANAGGDTNGVLTPLADGVRVERALAALDLHLVCASDLAFSYAEDDHGFVHGVVNRHGVMHAETNATDALCLAVAPDAEEAADLPEVETRKDDDLLVIRVHGAGVDHLIVLSAGGAMWTIPADWSGREQVSSDADFAIVRWSDAEAFAAILAREGGSFLAVGP